MQWNNVARPEWFRTFISSCIHSVLTPQSSQRSDVSPFLSKTSHFRDTILRLLKIEKLGNAPIDLSLTLSN